MLRCLMYFDNPDEDHVQLSAEADIVEVRRDVDTEATLTVSVDAHPEPQLTWYFEQKPVDLNNMEKYSYL